MDAIQIFFVILIYLPQVFFHHPQFLLYLGIACCVSFRLRKSSAGFRQLASMATYLGLGLLGTVLVHYQDFHHEFQRPLFLLMFSLLPSLVVAFGVLLLVQLALSKADPSEPTISTPTQIPSSTQTPVTTENPAPRPESVRSNPESRLIAATAAAFFLTGIVALAIFARAVDSSNKGLEKARRMHRAENFEYSSSQGELDLKQVKVGKCGISLTPQSMKVVTRYGFQVIPWKICRELQVSSGRAQFLIEVDRRKILLSPLEEPTGDHAWRAANYWQPALTRIQELNLMRADQNAPGPLRLFRQEEVAPPALGEFFPLSGDVYKGLSLEILRTHDWENGVTLCKEGLVVRDICEIRSVAWKDIRKLVVDTAPTVLRVVCGDEDQTLELLTSGRATQRLSAKERDALQKELISILGLKLSQKESTSSSRIYVPSRGSVDAPGWPYLLRAHLGKAW